MAGGSAHTQMPPMMTDLAPLVHHTFFVQVPHQNQVNTTTVATDFPAGTTTKTTSILEVDGKAGCALVLPTLLIIHLQVGPLRCVEFDANCKTIPS